MILKRLLTALLCGAVPLCALCACSNPNEFTKDELLSANYTRSEDASVTYNYADGAEEQPAAYNSYANLITGYELKLFRFTAAQNKTFAFSPSADALGLSLLANGAKDDTLSEIMLALGSELSLDDLNTCSSYFKSRMESVAKQNSEKKDELSGKTITDDTAVPVNLYGALLFNDKTDVRTTFLQKNADFYGEDIARFNFDDENSNTKLNTLMGTELEVKKDDSLYSVNYAKFSDLWLKPYGAEDISSGKFGGNETSFMSSAENYLHTDSAEGIIKYTAKNPLKLVLVMPNKDIKIEDYVKTFDSVEYSKLLESFNATSTANASVPQIEISASGTPTAISSTLQKSGLYTLFSDKADFGNLAHSDNVRLNEFYELNNGFCLDKNGVSTATDKLPDSTLAKGSSAQDTTGKAKALVFDRPFIFMLIDNETSIPVYMGVYSN